MAGPDDHSPLLSPAGGNKTAQGTTSGQTTSTGATAPSKPAPSYNATAPTTPFVAKADTNISWGAPAGLGVRAQNDESLVIFRKALGINYTDDAKTEAHTLEEGRSKAVGIYATVIKSKRSNNLQHTLLSGLLYFCYFAQIIIGAALTAFGPNAGSYSLTITLLGAFNTVIAGVLALIKGHGLPERMHKDAVEYGKLQDWIEETEALLAVGVIGRDRREVGLLVESAFKKYNQARRREDTNHSEMDNYMQQTAAMDQGPQGGAESKPPRLQTGR